MMKQLHFVLGCLVLYGLCLQGSAAETNSLRMRLSFGQRETKRTTYSARSFPVHGRQSIGNARRGSESGCCRKRPGRAACWRREVRAIECDVTMPALTRPPRKIHETWEHLLKNTTPDAAQRLRDDPAMRHDSPMLTVELTRMAPEVFRSDSSNCVSTERCGFPKRCLCYPRRCTSGLRHTPRLAERRALSARPRRARAGGKLWQYTALGRHGQPGLHESAFHSARPHCRSRMGQLALQVRHRSPGRDSQRLRQSRCLPFSFRIGRCGQGLARSKAGGWSPLITSIFEEAGLRYEIEQFATPLLGLPASAAATSRW